MKLILIPKTRQGMTRAELQRHLEEVHGPLCLSLPEIADSFKRYTHHYAIDHARDPLLGYPVLPDRDALTIIVLESLEAMRRSQATAAFREIVRVDEDNFKEDEGSLGFPVREVVLHDGPVEGARKLFHFRTLVAGADRDAALAEWARRAAAVLAQGGVQRYVHNQTLVGPAGAPPYDAVDEIWLGDQVDAQFPAALTAALQAAVEGLFESSANAAMVTRQRVFIA